MSNVSNYFEQPTSNSNNNVLVLGGSVNTANGQSLKKVYLTAQIEDISTAGQTYVVSPVSGTITKIYSVLNGAITTANAILTPKINGAAITNASITIAHAGSIAGEIDFSIPTALNTVETGQAIEIETDGGSNGSVKTIITIEITLS